VLFNWESGETCKKVFLQGKGGIFSREPCEKSYIQLPDQMALSKVVFPILKLEMHGRNNLWGTRTRGTLRKILGGGSSEGRFGGVGFEGGHGGNAQREKKVLTQVKEKKKSALGEEGKDVLAWTSRRATGRGRGKRGLVF